MADDKSKSASQLRVPSAPGQDSSLAVTRLEFSSRQATHVHSHENECVVVVLEGTLCLQLQGRAITLRPGEVQRIPAYAQYRAEPLGLLNALRISVAPHNGSHPITFSDSDSDQYLWGV